METTIVTFPKHWSFMTKREQAIYHLGLLHARIVQLDDPAHPLHKDPILTDSRNYLVTLLPVFEKLATQ